MRISDWSSDVCSSDLNNRGFDMSVFAHRDFDQHEQVVFASDPETGLKAIIAIHDTTNGPALGGCRMWPYATEDDAVRDALRLSRGMTYTAAISDLPHGGGQAVVMRDARRQKPPDLMGADGRGEGSRKET